MEFVEQHGGDAVERRIVEHQPREHAFGDDLDARALGNLRAEAHAQAHRVADLFAQGRGHAGGGGARGQPARLQHQNFLVLRPGLVEQHQRHARGLAGARRRHQHGAIVRAKRGGQPRQRLVDRERFGKFAHYAYLTSRRRLAGRGEVGFAASRRPDQDLPRPPHALIRKAGAGDFLRRIDVAQVDQHRALHHVLQPLEIERAELLPFGHDHQRGGALGAVIGVLAERHIADDGFRLLHAGRIVGAHLGAHVLQRGDQRDRRRTRACRRYWA